MIDPICLPLYNFINKNTMIDWMYKPIILDWKTYNWRMNDNVIEYK